MASTGSRITHTHQCPRCGTTWECGEANYQDECPYPNSTLCIRCWAQAAPKEASVAAGRRGTERALSSLLKNPSPCYSEEPEATRNLLFSSTLVREHILRFARRENAVVQPDDRS